MDHHINRFSYIVIMHPLCVIKKLTHFIIFALFNPFNSLKLHTWIYNNRLKNLINRYNVKIFKNFLNFNIDILRSL